MSLRDNRARYDGHQAITTGVDSGRSTFTLDRSQLSWAVNTTTRDGFITTRPGWSEVDLTFLDADGSTDATVEAAFRSGGRFQGVSSYFADNGLSYLVALIGGRVFLIDVQTRNVQDLSTQSGLTNVGTTAQAWFCQAENFLIIQNGGVDGALIYDGETLRRSGYPLVNEVPPGSVMAYNNGRLWIANDLGNQFIGGDLVYSVTGNRKDVLGFTENTYLNGGGFFAIPAQAGSIVAMRSVAVQDNPTGQGPLIIFTTRGAFSVSAPFNRDDWQNTRSPIVTVSLLAQGATAQDSTVLVNGDIWFRAPDGIRSFVYAQRDHGTWVNTPLSREVSRALDYDTPGFLIYGSTVLFDNRLLATTQPYQVVVDGVTRGICHKGLVALDFSPVSRMFNRAQPAWEGVWTGLNILKVVTTDTIPSRSFIFALDTSNEVTLWEMSTNLRFDNDDVRIEGAWETPSYGFDTEGWNLRELRYGDFWVNRLFGQVDLTFTYRTDSDTNWRSWSTARFCSSTETCPTADCTLPTNIQEQFRSRVRLPAPPTFCNSINDTVTKLGYRFAVRVEFTGHLSMPQLRIVASDLPEEVEGGCPPTTCTAEASSGCPVDDYTYSIE